MIESIGLIRDEVYIANVVKCRPENNVDYCILKCRGKETLE